MVECRYRALKKVTWHCRLFQPMPEVQWSWDFVCAKINVEIWLNVAKFCLYLLIIFLRVSSALSILLILFLFEMKCRNKTMKFCSYLVFSGKQILFYRKSICFKNFHIVIFAVRSKGGGAKVALRWENKPVNLDLWPWIVSSLPKTRINLEKIDCQWGKIVCLN